AFYQEEKKSMEERIQTLEVCEKEVMSIREEHRIEMAKQKELIEEAHSNYQKELLNHSKDIETLYKTKDQLKELEGEINQYKTKATNANLLLKKNELLWTNEKETLNDTIKRLETRCDDLGKQNDILQEQYIQLNSQIQKIKEIERDMESVDSNNIKLNNLDNSTQKKIDDLNEVIIFLRNEKEIAKCEKDVLEQKTISLKQQIEDLTTTLDRTKILLSEEKQNKESEYLQSKKDNEMLLEKVSQLNVYLESNERLREQNSLNEEKLEKLKNEHSDLMKKLEPLNQELRSIKAELGVKNQEIEALEYDNKNWKNRVNTILAKYERIDPIEFKQIKEDNEKLKKEKQEFEIQKQKLLTLEKEIAVVNNERDVLKAKINALSAKQNELNGILKSQKIEIIKKEEEHKKVIKELNEKHKQELENEK
ncbi:TPR/MLP1/MLP2-like protein-domain-containing protein, partial [Neocallimastix lanati (nom. inval.)]